MEKINPYEISRVLFIKSIFTAFKKNYNDDFYFSGEMHDYWELVYIVKGTAAITKGNKVFHLKAGDIAFHKPMEFHRLWADGSSFTVLVISFKAEGNALDILAENIHSVNLMQENTLLQLKQEIDESFSPTDGIYLKPQETAPFAVQLAVTHLELFLLDLLKSKSADEKVDDTKTAQSFSDIVKIMNQHIEENLSVAELAKLSNNSVSNLKRICHKYTGDGPAKHFTRLKIICAISLLESGESVTNVSERLAFVNPSYFSVVFKRETGYSPSDVRNNKKVLPKNIPVKSEYLLLNSDSDCISAC